MAASYHSSMDELKIQDIYMWVGTIYGPLGPHLNPETPRLGPFGYSFGANGEGYI